MKAVLGIDLENYPSAVELYRELAFAEAQTHLLHSVSSVLPDQSLPDLGPEHPITKIQKQREVEGREHLARAASLLGDDGAVQVVRYGDPSRVLIDYANEIEADLVGVGSVQKGTWSSLFYGSVTKALSSSAKQSFLVGKSKPRSGGLRAIWATDHSDYNSKCLGELLRLKPQGLAHVTILAATQMDPRASESLIRDMPQAYDSVMEGVVAEINARNQQLCHRFEQAGIESDTMFKQQHPTLAIESAMRETEADLLIMGSQGHNFWERIRLGSVSHHVLVATPFNALIIRV